MTVLRKNRILALALAGLLILSGCGSAQSSKGTEEGSTIEVAEKTQESSKGTEEASSVENDISADDTLTIAIADEINNIDIIHAYSHWVNLVLNGIVEGLFYYDNDSHIQSRLVESYDQPDEGHDCRGRRIILKVGKHNESMSFHKCTRKHR